jgi:two-component system sensor histidine kinase/response regulator
VEALKALNGNERLLVKMLHDFKKHYCSLPALLRELSLTGRWREIQDKAHTIKGVSGYIGSSSLMKEAQQLEDALRNDQVREATNHLASFIDALDTILSGLTALPGPQGENPPPTKEDPIPVDRTGDLEEQLRELIGQLNRGEVAAEKLFGKIEQRFAGTGFDGQVNKIAELIDDIEYEDAAKKAEALLTGIRQQGMN